MKNRKAEPGLRLINMEDVAVEQVEWLLYPFIPYGKVTIIQGDPGEGKTTMVLQIIAKLTKGESVLPVMDGEEEPAEKAGEPVNLIYQTAEDGLGDTIKPRLLAAGADCSKVLVIDDSEQPLTMLDERLEQAIRQTNARLVVLDPIQSFLGAEVDMHRANEIRPLMKRVSVLAEKYHCAIVLIGHMNKNSTGKSSYRGLGSIDFQAAARSVLIVGRVKNEPETRVVCHVKSSLAPEGKSIAFRLDKENGFEWIGEYDISADDLLSGNNRGQKIKEAKEFLLEILADGALERYNAKQTRKDRKIEDYYEKIRSGKQEKPFHEIILQIGDKDNMGATTKEGQMAARVLDEYMQDFQRRNPTLRVFSAHLHLDEATPHLHIDFVPYTTGSKRGLDTRVSLKQALSALGFKGGTRMETELNQWVAAEKQQLASIMLEHGIEWEQKGTHEKHLSLLNFEKQERAKEVAVLEEQKVELEEYNSTMQEVNEKWLDQLENIEREISSAHENRKKADKQADQAKKKAAEYEKKLTEIAPMVKDMERFAEKYSADPDDVLPEAGTLETGKSYREKKAKPLIKKIVTVLRSVYRAYLDLSRRFNDMQRSYTRAWNKVNSLTDRVEELWNENRMLRESLGDYERVKGVLGHDKIEAIVQIEKQREQMFKEKKWVRNRNEGRNVR